MKFRLCLHKRFSLPLVGLLLVSLFTVGPFLSQHSAYAASTVTIDGSTHYQTMDGFGFSEAFGPAQQIENLSSSSEQKQILDLLFSRQTGAGFSILRNLLPSDSNHTIEPNAPASPNATPTYRWDDNSWGQVWMAKQAQNYGVTQFYGDAWSAPGFMKNNGNESNGGQLCGSPGAATCSTGDWRQAYANYLVQYIKDYQSDGITLTQIGAFNEPTLQTTYSSMVMNPTQTADFISILGPTVKAAGLTPQIVCCDSEGWDTAQGYANGIASNATANAVTSIISSHGYTAAPTSALTGTGNKHIWETEWSTFDNWNPAWDDGSDASGFTWAQHIYTGITASNLNAVLYWWGANVNEADNQGLVNDINGTATPAKRLWAFANYSRFIRPGALRIGANPGQSNLEVTAYQNTDGTLSVVVLNPSYSAVSTSFALQNVTLPTGAVVTPYVTDASNNTAAQPALMLQNGSFSATVGARSLVTYQIASGTSVTPTPTATGTPVTPTPTATSTPVTPTPTATGTPPVGGCQVHYSVASQWPGGFTASITLNNTSSAAINGWTLAFAFPGSQQVTQGWNGQFSQTGNQVTIKNASYNGSIPVNGAVNIGFNGSWTGSNPSPTAFTLNGNTCSAV